jgi:hypothetical protein
LWAHVDHLASLPTSFCFGTTPAGLDFQAVHPTFEDDVKKQFNKFLKRTFCKFIPISDVDMAAN